MLLRQNVIFEINTGGISRGFKETPYPSAEILAYILDKDGKTIMSSDAHSKNTLMFGFDKYENYGNNAQKNPI